MRLLRLPEAFEALRAYFRPLDFHAAMDSPATIMVVVRDETGASCTLSEIPCGTSLSQAELFRLIRTIETHIQATNPRLMERIGRPRIQGSH